MQAGARTACGVCACAFLGVVQRKDEEVGVSAVTVGLAVALAILYIYCLLCSRVVRGSEEAVVSHESDIAWTHGLPGRWTGDESCCSSVYLHTDCEFLKVKFYNDQVLGDVLDVTSNAEVMMDDKTVPRCLGDVGIVLDKCSARHVHFSSLYDMRKNTLPGPTKAYGRAKQLIAWMDGYAEKIEAHIASVAIVIPTGFSAMLLKNIVNFVILVCQPSMGPRVFQGASGYEDAVAFLKERKRKYEGGELGAKPNETGQHYMNPPSEGSVKKGCSCHGGTNGGDSDDKRR